MVKINFLDIPDKQKQGGESSEDLTTYKSPREEMDFSFFQPEQDESTVDVQPREHPAASEVGDEDPASVFDETARFPEDGETNEPTMFDEGAGTRKFLLWGGIAAIVLILAVGAWFLIKSMSGGSTTPTTETTTPETVTPQPAEPAVPAAVQRRYAANQRENSSQLDYASNFLTTRPGNVDYQMMVLANGNIYVSVVGASREEIAIYRRAMKDAYPGLQMVAESDRTILVNGDSRLMVDFYVPVPEGSGGGGGGDRDYTNAETDLNGAVRALSGKHNLRLSGFREGDRSRGGDFAQTPVYMTLTGSQSGILAFLKELTGRVPGANFRKLSLYSDNAETMGGGRLRVRVELLHYQPS